jgi:hypothetical protein
MRVNTGRCTVLGRNRSTFSCWPASPVSSAPATSRCGCSTASFGVAAALAAALLARHIGFDRSAATLAGLIVAVNPFLLYYDTQIVHPLSMDTLLFVLTTHANVAAAEDPRGPKRRVVLAGLLTGLALWQRGALLVCGLALWAWALARDPGARRRQLGHAVIWLSFALAALAPWIIRNQVVLGRPVLTTDVPHIIWLGNNPLSNGTYSDMQGRRIFEVADPALRRRILGASELEQSAIFLGEARRFVADHPVTFVGLAARRALAFVWLSPNAGLAYEAWQQIAYVIAYGVLLASGTFGFMRFWNRADRAGRGRAALVVASVAGLLAVYAVTAINLRHRVPLEVVLGIFAAGLWNVGPRRPSA